MNDVTLKSKELEITKEFYQKSQISSIAKHLVLWGLGKQNKKNKHTELTYVYSDCKLSFPQTALTMEA